MRINMEKDECDHVEGLFRPGDINNDKWFEYIDFIYCPECGVKLDESR